MESKEERERERQRQRGRNRDEKRVSESDGCREGFRMRGIKRERRGEMR